MRSWMFGFAVDEDGAVTVDWVVLTASIVLAGFVAISIYSPAVTGKSSEISSAVQTLPFTAN